MSINLDRFTGSNDPDDEQPTDAQIAHTDQDNLARFQRLHRKAAELSALCQTVEELLNDVALDIQMAHERGEEYPIVTDNNISFHFQIIMSHLGWPKGTQALSGDEETLERMVRSIRNDLLHIMA